MAAARGARGFTLIELCVGMAVSMLVALGAAALLGHSMNENRKLLIEARVLQDLRSSLDLIERTARRAGYWRAADAAHASSNPNDALSPDPAVETPYASTLMLRSASADSPASGDSFGFRLRDGTIEALLGESRWQALTDAETVVVTELAFRTTSDEVDLETACSAGSTRLAPPARTRVRMLEIRITGHAARDRSVERTVRSTVRLRNDVVTTGCAP